MLLITEDIWGKRPQVLQRYNTRRRLVNHGFLSDPVVFGTVAVGGPIVEAEKSGAKDGSEMDEIFESLTGVHPTQPKSQVTHN